MTELTTTAIKTLAERPLTPAEWADLAADATATEMTEALATDDERDEREVAEEVAEEIAFSVAGIEY